MLKYCLDKWNKNRDLLEERIRTDTTLNTCSYEYLVELVVNNILNDNDVLEWDVQNISVIDDGSYQGTLLFTIPRKTYGPCEYDYLMTYIGYGSCPVCDILQSIQDEDNEDIVKDFMSLCKDILTNMIKPYNGGWRYNEDFAEIEWEDEE